MLHGIDMITLQGTSQCLDAQARWELKRMAKQLMPLMTQVIESTARAGSGFCLYALGVIFQSFGN
jgi:hypothetical protein